MKKFVKLVPILLALLVLGAASAFAYFKLKPQNINTLTQNLNNLLPQKETLKVKATTAKLTLQKPDGIQKEINAGEEEVVAVGDTLLTNTTGQATLRYPSGTLVRLAQETTITVASENTIKQDLGTVFVRFKALLGVQESFEVESQNMVASVRGTAFTSIVKKGKLPKIIVTDHEVEVTPKDEKTGEKLESAKKLIQKGEQGEITVKKAVAVAKQRLTLEEKKWIEFNDKEDNVLPSPTPTPKPAATSSASPKSTITPAPVSYGSSMPSAGYTRTRVKTTAGDFTLACYGAAQGSVRVVTDSANENDCKTDCPVLPLHDYATRNGGVAALNGTYFCPADYPACADKKNSFDMLFFNSRVKRYINSDNNVYSSLPFLVVHGDGSPRFVGVTRDWGRDTSIQAGIAGNPMLVSGGNLAAVEGSLDEKQRTVKANRGAFAQEGGLLYLCITEAATVMDSARVYQALGADNAINIDGGGSSAMWITGAYKYGPGRQIPNAIIFAK